MPLEKQDISRVNKHCPIKVQISQRDKQPNWLFCVYSEQRSLLTVSKPRLFTALGEITSFNECANRLMAVIRCHAIRLKNRFLNYFISILI